MSARPSRRTAATAPRSATPAQAMALYEQVKDHISRKIQEGIWRAGDRLPSENELVTQFGISRMTVNRALRELVEQGRIVRVAGVGSFVAEDKPQSTLLQIANLASEIRQRGHDYRCDVLAVERISATLEVAAALLEMSPQEPCLLLPRRTWSRGVPITVVRCLHPATRYRLGSRLRADGNPVAG